MIEEKELNPDSIIDPEAWQEMLPFEPAATSDSQNWVELRASRFINAPELEMDFPGLTHHMLILYLRPPDELEMHFEGMWRYAPPPPGAITLVPAGSPRQVRTRGCRDQRFIFLEPGLVERVAADAFDLDPAQITIPPLDGVELPQLRAAMLSVDAELTADGGGGRLVVESLGNFLSVQLIRQILSPRQPDRDRDKALPKRKLRTVVEYIEEHLDTGLTLEQMAAVANLSSYHFARQFKAATGLPPHQYVIARRIEWAQQLMQPDHELSLAEIAVRAGFSDQSQFSRHFKRIVGITPGEFRIFATIT